jgi:hypothetical protein
MRNRRDVLKGLTAATALPVIPIDLVALGRVARQPVAQVREPGKTTTLRIGLVGTRNPGQPDDENHYWSEAIEAGGKYYYRAKGVTVETTEDRYRKVIQNPHLYYFSSALWLHFQIQGVLKKQEASA